jgi:urease accessory protein UreF
LIKVGHRLKVACLADDLVTLDDHGIAIPVADERLVFCHEAEIVAVEQIQCFVNGAALTHHLVHQLENVGRRFVRTLRNLQRSCRRVIEEQAPVVHAALGIAVAVAEVHNAVLSV